MRKNRNITILMVLASVAVTGVPAVFCQPRTTPVQITEPVKVETGENPIKAAQDGLWITGIDPFYNTVKAMQSGAWTVSVGNTPNVNISSLPNIKIDPSANTVQQPVQQTSYLLWPTDQTVNSSYSTTSSKIPCKGYRELRVIVSTDSTSANLKARLWWYRTQGSSPIPVGEGDFASGSPSVVTGGNFKSLSNCTFTCPVMGDFCEIEIRNQTGAVVRVWSAHSWAYLTD